MKTMRDRFPWLDIPLSVQGEIEEQMPQFLLQEANRKRGEKFMRCTACGNVGIHDAVGKNRSRAVCPFCLEPVEIVDHVRLGTRNGELTNLRRGTDVMIFRAVDGILWAIDARATRIINRDSWAPEFSTDMDFYVHSVYRFEPGCAEQWKWGMVYDKDREGCKWYQDWVYHKTPIEPTNIRGYWGGNTEPYAVFGLEEEIPKTACRYSAIEEYFDDLSDGAKVRGVIKYLRAWANRPNLELVVKWGLSDIAEDLVEFRRTNGRYLNWKANTPWAFLKISKAEWNQYRTSECAGLELLQANRAWIKLPMGELLDLCEGLPPTRYWLDYARQMQEWGVPLKQQLKYIGKQEKHHDRDWTAWLRYWLDYLEMAEHMGRDVSINGAIMPRDLPEAHDQMVELQRMQKEAQQAQEQRQRAKELEKQHKDYKKRKKALEKKYGYHAGELMIRVPAGAEEIIREGNVLHICVGGYAARHLSGKTTILFLRRRRKPDTPYVCIEVREDGSIVQIHGYKNENISTGRRARSPMDTHRAFIEGWQAWVQAGSRRDKNGNPIIKQEVRTA